jgi:ascorbate-specific PTS system EIIC-type component UlaA
MRSLLWIFLLTVFVVITSKIMEQHFIYVTGKQRVLGAASLSIISAHLEMRGLLTIYQISIYDPAVI